MTSLCGVGKSGLGLFKLRLYPPDQMLDERCELGPQLATAAPDQAFVRKLGAIDRWSWTKSFAARVVTGGEW